MNKYGILKFEQLSKIYVYVFKNNNKIYTYLFQIAITTGDLIHPIFHSYLHIFDMLDQWCDEIRQETKFHRILHSAQRNILLALNIEFLHLVQLILDGFLLTTTHLLRFETNIVCIQMPFQQLTAYFFDI